MRKLSAVRARLLGPLKAVRRALSYFPLTWTGLLVVAGCLVALIPFGMEQLDLVLLATGVTGLALVGLSLVLATAAALVLWRAARARKHSPPLKLECGYWARTGFELPRPWYIPFVHVGWLWTSPETEVAARREGRRLCEEIRPARRGRSSRVERRLEVGDIFGLVRVAFPLRVDRQVVFLPWMGALRNMHVVHGISGGEDTYHPEGPPEGDRYDMRRYAAGDPVRFILWKVFAKTRTLLVRTPEQSMSPDRQTAAYLVAGLHDEPAAGAARVAVDSGALGPNWILGADGCAQTADNREEALELLTLSAGAGAEESGAGLGHFMKSAGSTISRAVVFVPAKPGDWMARVLQAGRPAAGQSARVEFVVCTDGIARPPHKRWWQRWALVPGRASDPDNGRPPADWNDLSAVVKTLRGARTKVLVVDRRAGQIFSDSHLGRLGGGSER